MIELYRKRLQSFNLDDESLQYTIGNSMMEILKYVKSNRNLFKDIVVKDF